MMLSPAALLRCFASAGLIVVPTGLFAANYEFLPAPETDLNRVYRLDRATGEIGACQYGLKEEFGRRDALLPARRGGGRAAIERIWAHRLASRARRRRVPGRPANRHDVDLLRAQRFRGLHAPGEIDHAACGVGLDG